MPKSSDARSPLKPPQVSVSSPRATSNPVGMSSPKVATAYPATPAPAVTDSLKLIMGAGGIYAAFLYYGSLQEDVFHYASASGEKFKYAWFLQLIGNYGGCIQSSFCSSFSALPSVAQSQSLSRTC